MTTKVPSIMRAITANGNKATLSNIAVPKLRPTYVLVKVNSVALNPTDWKHISKSMTAPGGISGCDFSGTVVEVGSDVTKPLKPGDRVAGVVHGANANNPEDGCFAEYTMAKGDLLIKIPDQLPFEQAATFPLGAFTTGQGLFQQGVLPNLPTKPVAQPEPVLIYGGSTATGALAIQYAKLAGYRVLTTCSPHNNDFVKSLGADAVYDYRDPECGKKINADTQNALKHVWDTISLEASARVSADALSSDGSGTRYGCILPVKFPRDDVRYTHTLMYTIFNEDFAKGNNKFPASSEDFAFAKEFAGITEKLLAEKKLRTHREQVGAKGLEGVLQGLEDLKNDKVSGNKLVYRVEETPADSAAEVTL